MSRNYDTLDPTSTGPQVRVIVNDSLAALLSTHLSTSAGIPAYAVDGTIYIEDQGTEGWKYWVVRGSDAVVLGEDIWNSWDGDRDFGLNLSKNFVLESVTSVPSDATEGRLVVVDSGTGDPGKLYFCDASTWKKILTSKQDPDDGGYYTRKIKISPDTSILNLTGSSDVSWTTLNVGSLVTGLSGLATADLSSVVVNVRLRDSGGRATLSLRKGNDASDSGYKTLSTVAAETSVYVYGQFEVFTNAGLIQYQLDASGSNTADVQITVECANIAS